MRVFFMFAVVAAVVLFNYLSHRFATRRDSSITYIAGQIGAGKSAYSVKLARAALKRGRPVYCTDYIEGCNRFNLDWLRTSKCPEGSLLIIDEAALKFNSRDFAHVGTDILSYFKRARHFGNDVVLISQTFTDADKQIREVANKVLFIRKLGWLSMPVRVRGDIAIGDDGQPAMKYRIAKLARPFIPALQGKYYDSFNDDEDRPLVPVIPWDASTFPDVEASPSSPVERDDLVQGYGAAPGTISGTTSPNGVEFTRDDAKKLIADFKKGKGIDLSKFLPGSFPGTAADDDPPNPDLPL